MTPTAFEEALSNPGTLPYSGAPIDNLFRERWYSGLHIGAARPVCTVEIRRGVLDRSYHPYTEFSNPPFGVFPGASSSGFWYADWRPTGEWVDITGIRNVRLEQSFDNNGVTSATILFDNIFMNPTESKIAGLFYHQRELGYYSPLRGYTSPGRPSIDVFATPFFEQLPNAQIRVRQGYGDDTMVTTFMGLVDTVDIESVPAQITLTCRDFGGVLVDQTFFGWAKEKSLTDPIVFASRDTAEDRVRVGGGAAASGTEAGHTPTSVVDATNSNEWVSVAHTTPDNTVWIEVHLPAGQYSSFYFDSKMSNLELYVGLFAKAQGDVHNGYTHPTVNGQKITDDQIQFGATQTDDSGNAVNVGWFDLGQVVPGEQGGWAYQGYVDRSKPGGQELPLIGTFVVGDDTVLRIGIRNLQYVDEILPDGSHVYQATVNVLKGIKTSLSSAAKNGKWIVIDDVTEIVECCLRWAGFKNWEVETAGVNLQENYTVDKSVTFMDAVNTVKQMIGWTFFIGEPRDDTDDQDLGWPIFRNNRVFENITGPTEVISDDNLLTAAKVSISNQNEVFIIRCRGIGVNDGVPLGSDQVKRIMYTYLPPWFENMAGVVKHLTHVDENFTTLADCQFGCYLIALQIALSKYTAILDLPGHPGIGLDTLQTIIDRGQGLNSRVYVTNRTSEMQLGDDGYYTTELGGSLVDTPDVVGVLRDFIGGLLAIDLNAYNRKTRKRVPSAVNGSNISQYANT